MQEGESSRAQRRNYQRPDRWGAPRESERVREKDRERARKRKRTPGGGGWAKDRVGGRVTSLSAGARGGRGQSLKSFPFKYNDLEGELVDTSHELTEGKEAGSHEGGLECVAGACVGACARAYQQPPKARLVCVCVCVCVCMHLCVCGVCVCVCLCVCVCARACACVGTR